MQSVYFLSKQYHDKTTILKQIEDFGIEKKYEITKKIDRPSELNDIYLWMEDLFQLEFWIIDEDEFERDEFVIDNSSYYIMLTIDYIHGSLPYLNQFIREFLVNYPNILVTDESFEEGYYSLEQIENEEVPKWLLEKFSD